jgi:hypothetical protein
MDVKEVPKAKALLAVGMERAKALHAGEAPWNAQTGLVVRGYRSDIDRLRCSRTACSSRRISSSARRRRRLDFWCHGRGEKLTELAFIDRFDAQQRRVRSGFTTPGIVCFLYGRFCNANKFAGERDLFETLDDIRRHYAIDMQRLVSARVLDGRRSVLAVRHASFPECGRQPHRARLCRRPRNSSMSSQKARRLRLGGSRCFGVGTIARRWPRTSPTRASSPTPARSMARNKAADIMVKYAKQEGIEFPHIIGPQTAHKYHPESKPKIEELVTAAIGITTARRKRCSDDLHAHYPTNFWVTIRAMDRQWERADVDVEVTNTEVVKVKTRNVASLELQSAGDGAAAQGHAQDRDRPEKFEHPRATHGSRFGGPTKGGRFKVPVTSKVRARPAAQKICLCPAME